jgi:hypothetical protein
VCVCVCVRVCVCVCGSGRGGGKSLAAPAAPSARWDGSTSHGSGLTGLPWQVSLTSSSWTDGGSGGSSADSLWWYVRNLHAVDQRGRAHSERTVTLLCGCSFREGACSECGCMILLVGKQAAARRARGGTSTFKGSRDSATRVPGRKIIGRVTR